MNLNRPTISSCRQEMAQAHLRESRVSGLWGSLSLGLLALVALGSLALPLMGSAPNQASPPVTQEDTAPEAKVPIEGELPAGVADYLLLLAGDQEQRRAALERVEAGWHQSSPAMLLEVLYFLREPSTAQAALDLLERRTDQAIGFDISSWYEWLWAQDIDPHSSYPLFKSHLYRKIDPRFGGYFSPESQSLIRLDEIRWGGVGQDGIPPLRSPKMLQAKQAKYLEDSNVVFGIEVEGEARAYPKRILAWHEMFVDEIADIPLAGVYCTLCGTVILYETTVEGQLHEMGTSGFLYRSNKLMYDRATQSLWNTFSGRPVVGPLVGKGIELPRRSVVTTTWGEWRRRHPETTVLSLETGHQRDYSEGAAYREYFATDEVMFNVPSLDRRLRNKAEVLALTFPEAPEQQLAIAQDFLLKNSVYHDSLGDLEFVVLTDKSGANRVYASEEVVFKSWNRNQTVRSKDGDVWTMSESSLTSEDGRKLVRLPSQRAFWFGWQASFPDTRLVR